MHNILLVVLFEAHQFAVGVVVISVTTGGVLPDELAGGIPTVICRLAVDGFASSQPVVVVEMNTAEVADTQREKGYALLISSVCIP